MALQLSEKDLENPEVLGKKLMTLSEIIISRHFYASSYMKEDLVSIGVLSALEVINKDYFDPSKGNFATFIYGTVRNNLHNYLYHYNKTVTVDLDTLVNQGVEDSYFQGNDVVYLSYSLIHTVCLNFVKAFGDNLENSVINKLKELGYEISGRKQSGTTVIYMYDPILEEYGEEAEAEIVSRVIGLILWKHNATQRALSQ